MQLRARTRCPLRAANSHTSELRSVFSEAHVPGKNEFDWFFACERKTLRGFFDKLWPRSSDRGLFYALRQMRFKALVTGKPRERGLQSGSLSATMALTMIIGGE